jgi:hypothetical protein
MTNQPLPRCKDDNGSVVLEFALILPFLATMVSGILELGLLFRQQNMLAGVAQAAARTGSHAGKDRSADRLTLASINAQLGQLPNTQLVKVVIYKSVALDGSLPGGCGASPSAIVSNGVGVNGSCNIYSPAQVAAAAAGTTYFGGTPSVSCAGGATSSLDRFWCPNDRRDTLATNPDFFGVSITADYTYVTKLFGAGPKQVNERAVFRVEVLG